MRSYSFGLIVAGADFTDDDLVDALYEAGVEDASFGVRDGTNVAYFDREAPSFPVALTDAIRELELALPGIKVCGIDADDLLTPAGVANLASRTRQSVHQHIRGSRGSGFPPPISWADRARPLWLWRDVSDWSGRQGDSDDNDLDDYWPSMASGAFHFVRASCTHDRDGFAPALDFLFERYLTLSSADGITRHELSEHLRVLADRLEQPTA